MVYTYELRHLHLLNSDNSVRNHVCFLILADITQIIDNPCQLLQVEILHCGAQRVVQKSSTVHTTIGVHRRDNSSADWIWPFCASPREVSFLSCCHRLDRYRLSRPPSAIKHAAAHLVARSPYGASASSRMIPMSGDSFHLCGHDPSSCVETSRNCRRLLFWLRMAVNAVMPNVVIFGMFPARRKPLSWPHPSSSTPWLLGCCGRELGVEATRFQWVYWWVKTQARERN